MKRCEHCRSLGQSVRAYRDIQGEPFAVLRIGCFRDPRVVLRTHEGKPTMVVKVGAMVALKAVASRLYGNAYYIQVDPKVEHWNASARKLWVNQLEPEGEVV